MTGNTSQVVISTLLYGAELWPLPVTQMKTLEAAHHKFQRRLLGITWKDNVRNEEIRKTTGRQKLELVIKERRLRWLGHVLRMEDSRVPRQAIQWELSRATRLQDNGQQAGWLVEQGLTSHSTQFKSFRRRCFYWSDDPTNSVKALKEGG